MSCSTSAISSKYERNARILPFSNSAKVAPPTWTCRPVAGTVSSSSSTSVPVWSASSRHSAVAFGPCSCRLRTETVTLDSASSRSARASDSSAIDETCSAGDHPVTLSVNMVFGSWSEAPTSVSRACTNVVARSSLMRFSSRWGTASSGEQLGLRDRELLVGQGAGLVELGELLDLVEVAGVRPGVRRRCRGVLRRHLRGRVVCLLLLLFVAAVLLAGVVRGRTRRCFSNQNSTPRAPSHHAHGDLPVPGPHRRSRPG